MAKDGMTKPRGCSLLKMCCSSREDNMSLGPQIVVDVRHMRGGCSPEGRIHERKWWCYAPVLLGHIFGGLLRLSSLSTDFSSYSAMHATDRTAGTGRGPLS